MLRAVRWFILDRGGFVRAYVAAPERLPRDEVVSLIAVEEACEAFTLDEMLSDEERYEALRRWQRGDDSALEVADAAVQVLIEAEESPPEE
jgi:hypothetical protein